MPDVEQALSFVDPSGVESPLHAGSVEVEFGVEGRGMPPVESVIDVIPGQPGGRRRQTRFGVREVVLPLEVFGGSQSDLRGTLRSLARAFDPTRGDGRLVSTAPDGSVREIVCRYSSGMELVEDLDLLGNVQRAGVVFSAVDPYWYDGAATAVTFGPTQASFFPFFPLRLSASEVYADTEVDNEGDVESWPVWTIAGPGTSPVLRNLTTGKSLDLTGVVLGRGETVEIDTRPGFKTVRRGDGTNLYPDLTATSSLWPLVEGHNSLRLELSATTAETSFALNFHRRWLSA